MFLEGRHLARVTASTITQAAELKADLRRSRRRGYFVTRGENVADVTAVARTMAVEAEMVGVCVAGPTHRMKPKLAAVGHALLETAAAVSAGGGAQAGSTDHAPAHGDGSAARPVEATRAHEARRASGKVERFPELRDDELDTEQQRVAAAIVGGPRGGLPGPFVPLLHNPALADRVQRLGAYFRFECALPADLKELAVLLTARHWTAQFEWSAHSRFALEAGISQEIVAAIAADRRPSDLSAAQAAVYDFCIELHRRGRVSDHVFQCALDHLDHRSLMDVIGLCGYYTLIAMVLDVAQVPVPEGEPLLGQSQAPSV